MIDIRPLISLGYPTNSTSLYGTRLSRAWRLCKAYPTLTGANLCGGWFAPLTFRRRHLRSKRLEHICDRRSSSVLSPTLCSSSLLLCLGFQRSMPQSQPRVVRFSPKGTVKNVRQVTAQFSEPMVPLGRAFGRRDAVRQSIARERGSARWIDTADGPTTSTTTCRPGCDALSASVPTCAPWPGRHSRRGPNFTSIPAGPRSSNRCRGRVARMSMSSRRLCWCSTPSPTSRRLLPMRDFPSRGCRNVSASMS